MNTLFYRTKAPRFVVQAVYRLLIVASLFISGCSVLQPVEKPIEKTCPALVDKVCPVCVQNSCPAIVKQVIKTPKKTRGVLDLPVIGELEDVIVHPSNLRFVARIDTGAKSTSIHAENIQLIEREGKRFVRFSLLDKKNNKLVQLERRFRRKVIIKQQDGDNELRYVVTLWVTLGKTKDEIEVTLTDRSVYNYEVLVGRNLLTDRAIVDVSLRHTLRH
ncbi:MAG: ATP-dependent zinc protease [Cycloclasticus sp.]|nr:ATP-dependent zinc protease [Cycloclasticus sp.]MBQ0789533.1 ATP-dependent zinc protease [Cycloclasticus sp.]